MKNFTNSFLSLKIVPILLLGLFSYFTGNSQCTTAVNGQYPSTTVPLNTNCVQLTVTSAAWTGEYSVLSGAGANTYTFSSSVATDFITITDDATNTAIAWGVSPLSYTFASAPGNIRLYRHDNASCGATSTSRSIYATCTSCSAGVLTCPTLSTPANAATGISLTPTLTWAASTNSASYDVYLGTSVAGATLLTNTVSTSYTVLSGVLSGNTTYYWYVAPRGCDNSTIACDGGAYSFTTQNPPPAFDEPCGAVALTVGTSCSYTTYTSVGCTGTSGPPAPGCASYSTGDVWFSFVVPASGAVVINTQAGTITDSGMAIYSSSDNTCTGTFTLIECDDDDSPNGSMSLISKSGLTPGNTIFIRFWDYNDLTGTFDLCITEPVANDNCAGAIALTPSVDLTCTTAVTGQSTVYSTQSQAGCSGTADDDIWYSFVATSALHNVTLSNVTGSPTMVTQVFSGSCGALVSVVCSTTYSTALTGLTVGNTYYIRVHTSNASGTYATSFDICVTTTVAPSCTTNTAPANAATGVSLTPTLTWAAATGATSYDLYISPVPTGSWTNPTNVAATTYTILAGNTLVNNTAYTWYVVPKNAAGSASGCTANATTFTTVAGPTTFSGTGNWSDPTKWSGGVPSCSTPAIIATSANCTLDVNGAALSLTSSGILNIASATLTVGLCTDVSGGKQLMTFNSGSTLNLSGGTLKHNGSVNFASGSFFNQTGGDFNIDANDGTAGNSASTYPLQFNNAGSANVLSGGNITFVDPPYTSTTTLYYNNSTAATTASGTHTFIFGDGTSSTSGGNTSGFLVNTWVGSSRLLFNNVIINGPSVTNRQVSSSWSFGIAGDLTINSGGEFRPAVATYLAKNITNNGTFTQSSTTYLGTYVAGTPGATTSAQTISGSGVWRNAATSPTANIATLTVNNTSGTAIVVPASMISGTGTGSVSGTLTLTAGKLDIGSTPMTLGISTATLGTLSPATPTSASYIIGEFRRWRNTALTNYYFPVGTLTTPRFSQMSFTVAQTTGGVIGVKFVPGSPTLTGIPYTDNSILIQAISPTGYWNVERISGAGGTYTHTVDASGFTKVDGSTVITDFANIRLIKRATNATWGVNNWEGTAAAPAGLSAITRSACTTFSDFAVGGTNGALPLELTSFTGKTMDRSNMLLWETAVEKEVAFHVIERSIEGASWTEIGRVAGQLDSNTPTKYTLEDKTPVAKAYYRLRSEDLNGDESISNTIILIRKADHVGITGVFPSPTTGTTTVQYATEVEKTLTLRVTDIAGRLVMEQTFESVNGFNNIPVDMTSLEAGLYLVNIVDGNTLSAPVQVVKQ